MAFLSRLTTLFTLTCLLQAGSAIADEPMPAPPTLNAKSWILIDAGTGSVLVEHNADEKLPPASLTKLMTSYVLSYEVEAGRVHNDDMVTVSKNAWSQNPTFGAKFNGSSLMFIAPDKPVSIIDLHRGIVISSGNDATVAVAEHLAGTETAFADMMNQHAEKLGMAHSHFVNPHGLDDPNHYTTAKDLSLLASAIIKQRDYPLHAEKAFTYNNINQPNRNGLLWKDNSVDGLKTGYTEGAGYCLVASDLRDGTRLISVVMGAPSVKEREDQSMALLNYGFRFFQTVHFFAADAVLEQARVWKSSVTTVNIVPAKAIEMTIARNAAQNAKTEIHIQKPLIGPLAKGQKVGEILIKNSDTVLATVDAITQEEAPRAGLFGVIWDSLVLLFSQLFGKDV